MKALHPGVVTMALNNALWSQEEEAVLAKIPSVQCVHVCVCACVLKCIIKYCACVYIIACMHMCTCTQLNTVHLHCMHVCT